ncbi:MAG: hypothetical protein HZA79_02655 [Sphingobacteriales bacterium]|nr:hypothetical protein [Sphingobacteriales bacterium]
MNWNSIMGLVSSLALFGPVLLILILGLGRYRSFPVLLLYYSSAFIYNLITEHYILVSAEAEYYWGLLNNIADPPLMILFLTYFSTSRTFTQRMKWLALAFAVFEVVIVAVVGLNTEAITILMGPGLLLVFGLAMYFFIRHTKQAIENRKATGKAMIVTSLLFAYGCYFLIYMLYYVFKAHVDKNGEENIQYVNDTFLVYYIAASLSSFMLCVGLVVEQKRIRKLKELKVTRKELSSLYTDTKRAVPLRTALLDFDREQWN